MTSKDSNCHKRILRDAEAGRYGVLAAIAYNIEQVLGSSYRESLITTHHPIISLGYRGNIWLVAADRRGCSETREGPDQYTSRPRPIRECYQAGCTPYF